MQKKNLWKAVIGVAIVLVAFFIIRAYTTNIFSNLEVLKSLILSWGVFGPLVVVFLQIIQGMTSFFPDSAVIMASGYLYGPALGIFYNTIGELTAAVLFYMIARSYGKKILQTFVKEQHVNHFQKILNKKGVWAIFFCRILPVFPNNIINFTAGFAKLRLGTVVLINLIAILPYTTLFAFFGDQVDVILRSPKLLLIAAVILVIWITTYMYFESFKRWILKKAGIKNNEKEKH